MASRVLSQLAHVELTTPTPEESLEFWTDVVGLEVSATVDRSVYLRGWGDRFHHTLVLTEGSEVGLGHVAWRADGSEQLTRPSGAWRPRASVTAGSRPVSAMGAPIGTGRPAVTFTRSSGRSTATRLRQTWSRPSRTVRSATCRAGSRPAASTT